MYHYILCDISGKTYVILFNWIIYFTHVGTGEGFQLKFFGNIYQVLNLGTVKREGIH